MLGIKYFTRRFPGSDLARWQRSNTDNKLVRQIKSYIFNDLYSLLVHISLSLIFSVLINFTPEYGVIENIMYLCLMYLGVIPMTLNYLPYLIYAIFIYPIKKIFGKA